ISIKQLSIKQNSKDQTDLSASLKAMSTLGERSYRALLRHRRDRSESEMMNQAFELWVRMRYGNRYDLTRDIQGLYCREVVKRMF
ncbi:hypothetical protein, partial [Enterobacter hormaechei]|uniref:hypothetical protein n=1 Tax=Enterobacter hormaechei TaxID=158836 RepID=UPI0007ABCAC8